MSARLIIAFALLFGVIACASEQHSPSFELGAAVANPLIVEKATPPSRTRESAFSSQRPLSPRRINGPIAPDGTDTDREPTFAALPNPDLWSRIVKSGGIALIGLKAPQQIRGVWHNRILLDTSRWEVAKRAVTSISGVTLIAADDVLPTITIRLDNARTMQKVRSLPAVDYIEPLHLPTRLLQQIGCAKDPWGTLPVPFTLDEMRLPGDFPDVMPWNFRYHSIPEAWARGVTGAGVKIAVIDTGVIEKQTQLRHPTFSTPAALGVSRNIWHHFTHGNDSWDDCGHGTRMAGTVAAPHDGANIVGVAWKSDLVVIRALPGVLVTGLNISEVAEAIRSAAQAHEVKVIVMAFGDAFASARIADEIRLQHASRDVLFIAAAGTYACPEGFVAFPARMDEVVAVTGETEDGKIHPDACSGPQVDLSAVIGEVPAPGRMEDEIIHFGGSSNASAIVGGIAALVWSENPQESRDTVREKLYSTAGHGFRDGSKGFGRVNAYRAVGGFWSLAISGPTVVKPGDSYSLRAKPQGGGPNWAYRWSNGASTESISSVGPPNRDSQRWSLEVTDLRDGTTLKATHRVDAKDPAAVAEDAERREICERRCEEQQNQCFQAEPPEIGCRRAYATCVRRCALQF
jgi:serine protease